MGKRIKGTLFVDYVRMIRGRRDLDWDRYLTAGDREILATRIEPDSWYPMDSFERMGVAILHEIAGGSMEAVYEWGRYYMDSLLAKHDNIVARGDPMESLMRFHVYRSTFFDFEAVRVEGLMGNETTLRIEYGLGSPAEEASAHQTVGFFIRLLETSGATDISFEFIRRSWTDGPPTIVKLTWS